MSRVQKALLRSRFKPGTKITYKKGRASKIYEPGHAPRQRTNRYKRYPVGTKLKLS